MGSPRPGHEEVSLYVPREATERALDEMDGLLQAGRWCVSLLGPRRTGKSLLLRVLTQRLPERFHCAETSAGELARKDVASVVLAALGIEAEDEAEHLAELAKRLRERKQAIALLVDDAHELPPETQRALAAALSRCKGGLRAVLAGPVRSPLVSIGRTLEPSNECVWLRERTPELKRVAPRSESLRATT